MNSTNCNELNQSHHYGLWSISEDNEYGFRSCETCGFIEKLPLTVEILEEIKKQNWALENFKIFRDCKPKTPETSLEMSTIMLDIFYNYLDEEAKKYVIEKSKTTTTEYNNGILNTISKRTH